jgi:hypothetical protein
MVYDLHKFQHYLLGNKFVFYVNHMAFYISSRNHKCQIKLLNGCFFFGIWFFNGV